MEDYRKFKGKRICIALNKDKPKYSETFLQAHIDNFADTVINIYKFIPYPDIETKLQNPIRRQKISDFAKKVINLYGSLRLKFYLRKNKVDLVLAEYGHVGALLAKACQELHISLIVHYHGHDAYRKIILENYGTLYKRMFQYSSAIIAVSKDMSEQLVGLGADPTKIRLNVYGVNLGMFSLACPKGSPPHLLAIGRFVEKKAPYLTILAFHKIVNRVPGAKLIMVGDGELVEVCQRIIVAYHLQEAVQLKNEVSHEEVAELMKNARAYVQHSLIPASGDSEGTPVTILEAGASGLPVISTLHAGIKDVVIHEKTGFLVEEGDIDTMSQYMYILLTDPMKAQEMGEKARQHIAYNYNMRKSLDNLNMIIESAL